jgi:hypothetical protein
MNRIVQLKDLTPSAVSRSRGNEAYHKIMQHLDAEDSMEIDLRGQDLISISFLDEVVIKLQSVNLLDKVTFIFVADDIHQRLAQIAAIRSAQIFYKCSEEEDRRIVEVRPVSGLELRKVRSAGGRKP